MNVSNAKFIDNSERVYAEFLETYHLLHCPFCGQNNDLGFEEFRRQDHRTVNKNGVTHKRINIEHHVQCSSCGAAGGSCYSCPDAEILTEMMVADSKQAAALLWNARAPISDKAFELVNKLIISAINGIDARNGKEK